MKVNSDKCAYFRKALIFKWGPTAGEANRADIILLLVVLSFLMKSQQSPTKLQNESAHPQTKK